MLISDVEAHAAIRRMAKKIMIMMQRTINEHKAEKLLNGKYEMRSFWECCRVTLKVMLQIVGWQNNDDVRNALLTSTLNNRAACAKLRH